MNRFIRNTLFVLLFLTVIFSNAQEEPKVGLVLSGGGAKGLAHIGALKVIEEAGVKIDYIGGTSMGAIIGGLYASGYSADQLDSIFRNRDLAELIQDNVPRSSKTFYEKEDSERYALSLPFDGFKVSFPAGISTGQDIYNELVQFLYHVKDINDFNELPIPFVCVATNVETGEPVLLDHGFLPEAIMASGTLPSFFEPSQIDGNVLIDGGVVNNYPIKEVRDLGADIIIGVDVQHGLANRESLGSAPDILLQINNYRTVNDMIKKSKDTDIYIKPGIEDYSIIDFLKTDEIIETGVKAAKESFEELQELAESQSGKIQKKADHKIADSLVVNRMILNGNENYSRGYVKGKLRFDLGTSITFKKLKQGINNLAATDNFKAIRYELTSNGLGTDLTLNLNEKPNRLYLKVGAHYDDLLKSGALINLTHKRFLTKDDVASFDLILGDHIRYNLEYYIDKGAYWSFGVKSSFADLDEEVSFDLVRNNFEVENTTNLNEITFDLSDWTNQIYLETVLREEFALRLGVEHKNLKYSTRTLSQADPQETTISGPPSRTYFEKSNFYSAFGKLRLDTYDDSYFPSSGLFFDGDFHVYLFSSDFNNNFKEFSIAQGRMGAAFGIFPNMSLNLETGGGFKLGTSGVTSFDFVLGGYGNKPINNIIPFFGYDFLSLPGNSYIKALAKLDYEFTPKTHLLFASNIANVDDDLFRTGEWFSEPEYVGFATGLGFESIIGPIQVFYSWSPQIDESEVLISVGYWF